MDPMQLTVEKLGDPHKAVTKFRVTSNLVLHTRIECVRCHAIKNKIKNHATDKVKKL